MTWKIIADSGCDYRQLATPAIDTTFVSVPLTIQVADQVFVDDASLDIDQNDGNHVCNRRSFKISLSKPR